MSPEPTKVLQVAITTVLVLAVGRLAVGVDLFRRNWRRAARVRVDRVMPPPPSDDE